MSFPGRLLADPVLSLNHWRLARRHRQLDRKFFRHPAQLLLIAFPLHLPVPVPHPPLFQACPGNPRPLPIEPLRVIKLAAIQIAQRQVRKIQIPRRPCSLRRIPVHPLAEKCQLESKPVPARRLKISRVVPPLRLVFRMVEVIARKRILVSRQRLLILRARHYRPQHQRDRRSPPTPHALPRSDSIAPPCAPGTIPPARSPHTRTSTRPPVPPPANETVSSIQTTAY